MTKKKTETMEEPQDLRITPPPIMVISGRAPTHAELKECEAKQMLLLNSIHGYTDSWTKPEENAFIIGYLTGIGLPVSQHIKIYVVAPSMNLNESTTKYMDDLDHEFFKNHVGKLSFIARASATAKDKRPTKRTRIANDI